MDCVLDRMVYSPIGASVENVSRAVCGHSDYLVIESIYSDLHKPVLSTSLSSVTSVMFLNRSLNVAFW